MIKKFFSVIASLAMILGMTFTANVVHAEDNVYPDYFTPVKEHAKLMMKPGETVNLDEYMKEYTYPENATLNEKTVRYSIESNDYGAVALNDDQTLTGLQNGYAQVRATLLGQDGNDLESTVMEVAVVDQITSFNFTQETYNYAFNSSYGNIALGGYSINTAPYYAANAMKIKDMEFSTSDSSVAEYEITENNGVRLIAKKPGDVTLYAKYKDLSTSAKLHIYEEKSATSINFPDEIDTYVNYTRDYQVTYGSEENCSTKFEIISGSEFLKLDYDETDNGNNFYTGIAPGEATVRITSATNPELTKDVRVIVHDGKPADEDNYPIQVFEVDDDGTETEVTGHNNQYTVMNGKEYHFVLTEIYTPQNEKDATGVFNELPFTRLTIGAFPSKMEETCLINKTGTVTYQMPGRTITFNCVTSDYKKYEYYGSDHQTKYSEYNKVLGFKNLKDEYTMYVGDYLDLDASMNWAVEPSGTYLMKDGEGATEGGLDEEYFQCLFFNNVLTVHPIKATTETFTFKRYGIEKKVTVHCVDKGTPILKEETKVNVDSSISKADAAKIEKTIAEAKVGNVAETISGKAKKELLAGIDTEGKDVEITVENTVTVVKADLSSKKKSVTFEISPEVTVKVDGKVVKKEELKNSQLNGKKDIEITLPLNGLDIKEIVHKSEGYDPEYIYDFTVNDDDTVTFKVSHFSSFTLNEEVTKPSVKPGTKSDSKTDAKGSPNTGDHSNVAVYGGISLFAIIGFAGIVLFRRKHS